MIDTDALRELADRQRIAELISRLGLMLDEKRMEDAGAIFAADAVADFPGDVRLHGVEEIAARGRNMLDAFERIQHVITNVIVELDGDRASARANLIATHVHHAERPDLHFTTGCTYHFGLVRTASGWRIGTLELRLVWTAGDSEGWNPDAEHGGSTDG